MWRFERKKREREEEEQEEKDKQRLLRFKESWRTLKRSGTTSTDEP